MPFLRIKFVWLPLVLLTIYSCSNSTIDELVAGDRQHSVEENEVKSNSGSALIKNFSFLKSQNANKLLFDIPCETFKDSIIECFSKNILKDKHLVASFDFWGDSVVLLSNDERVDSEKRFVDFSKDVILTVIAKNRRKNYIVKLYPYTGLPFVFIETTDGKDVLNRTSKSAYVRFLDNPDNPILGEQLKCDVAGHGNSTWGLPKKPYSLKLEKKTSLLSFPPSKSWLLIANHYDSTMVRNYIANYISSISKISYTPKQHFIELYLNGKYRGTYQLYEKVKVSQFRVNIEKNDFLLEVENHPRDKDVYFSVKHISRPVKIHSPDVLVDDENYKYINKILNDIDDVLFSKNFLDDYNGYKNYIDIDALVEWYVVTEITKNVSNINNWYMTYERDGMLKFGPFWDYDLAFGNTLWELKANETTDFWMNSLPWFERFAMDPVFVQKVKERFGYFYSKKNDILKKIDETALLLRTSVIYNDRLWNVFGCVDCSEGQILDLYDKHTMKMKNWLDARFEWLKNAFDHWNVSQ